MSAPEGNPPDAPPPYQEPDKGGAPPYPGTGAPPYPGTGAAYPPPPAGQQGYWQPQQQQPPAGYPGSYQQPHGSQPYWPQQQPTYGVAPQGYPVTSQPVTTTTTVHVMPTMFREVPVPTQCPNCHNHVTTQVTHEAGAMAWLMCFIMFLVGLWCCCCIPFCVDGLMDSNHNCPTCRHRIARYTPL